MSRRSLSRRETGVLAGVLGALFAIIQLLPVGAPRTNPPVVAEPSWSSPLTRELFVRSCADCHSNQTRWPWYAKVAPVSWLVAHDVAEARAHFNISEWHRPQRNAHKAADEVREGEMPYRGYAALHPEARLDEATKRELVAGLEATFRDRDAPPANRVQLPAASVPP